jgi:hypothetical protein
MGISWLKKLKFRIIKFQNLIHSEIGCRGNYPSNPLSLTNTTYETVTDQFKQGFDSAQPDNPAN